MAFKTDERIIAEARIAVAKKCVERIEALGLKGRKADDAALHFLCGAVTAFEYETINPKLVTALTVWVSLAVATRGMFEVRMVAATNPEVA